MIISSPVSTEGQSRIIVRLYSEEEFRKGVTYVHLYSVNKRSTCLSLSFDFGHQHHEIDVTLIRFDWD